MINVSDSPTWEYGTTSNHEATNIPKVNNVHYRMPNLEYGNLNERREPTDWNYQPTYHGGKERSPNIHVFNGC